MDTPAAGAATLHGIPPAQMQAVFPFHVAFDRHGRIVQQGAKLPLVCAPATVGADIGAVFRVLTPTGLTMDFEAISGQLFTVFFVECRASGAVLKGQMLPLDNGLPGLMLFLCSPMARDIDSLINLGLTLNDFAIHDATVDFLVLLQTKINTINDVRKMADRLKLEVQVRRDAERALQSANAELEQRVLERTGELSVTNRQLSDTVQQLEQRNREISLLNKMGDMLLACRGVREVFAVVVDSMQQMCPDVGGELLLYDAADDSFEVVAAWGGLASQGRHLQRHDCWGLRRAKAYHWDDARAPLCNHLADAPASPYSCVPLMVHGRFLGLFHMRFAQASADNLAGAQVAERRRLLASAADHVSLSIANLMLQETLRQQSIRDALTGLFNRRYMEETLQRELARALRQQVPVAVVLLDIDHFKQFNDTLGHLAGDALLTALGQMLAGDVRGEDVACRYGGEEFIVILPGAPLSAAQARAEFVRQQIEGALRVEFGGRTLPAVTASLGLACYPDHGADAAALVGAADAALYRAKKEGRNRVCVAG